jgi:hypothetical protein
MHQPALDFDRPAERAPEVYRHVARQEFVLLTVCTNAEAFKYVNVEWMRANWAVWEQFEREANTVWDTGRRRWGARWIGEHIRRETLLREVDGLFKVNDHIWPDLARLYLALNPEREGFFETRGRHT